MIFYGDKSEYIWIDDNRQTYTLSKGEGESKEILLYQRYICVAWSAYGAYINPI